MKEIYHIIQELENNKSKTLLKKISGQKRLRLKSVVEIDLELINNYFELT